jgi:protein MPE1
MSSVFFKFASQKEPTRVEFDGTGISVFELKREIISRVGLGDGTDFDLSIYDEHGRDEYDDDTTIIPRATVVMARRFPANKPGAGRAARYVSGKMPTQARIARKEQIAKDAEKARAAIVAAETEEEKMKAMFDAQLGSWTANKEDLAQYVSSLNHHPLPGARDKGHSSNLSSEKTGFQNRQGHRQANVPDHDPPNGYICYRCGEKGHWIQLCPTNDDPEFNNRRRVKRTTGIPRSFLTQVDKDVALAQASGDDETKRPAGLMVNADGEYVIARTDKEAWVKFQAKAAKPQATETTSGADDKKSLLERGLECPVDKKMFVEPMKTPCCGKTYCNDCITNALIESDFVCPSCSRDGVLLDDLQPDQEARAKMLEYLEEKDAAHKDKVREAEKARSASPTSDAATKQKSPPPAVKGARTETTMTERHEAASEKPKSHGFGSPKSASATPSQSEASLATSQSKDAKPDEQAAANPRKRRADDPLENNPKIPKGPKAMQQQMEAQDMQNMMGSMMGMPGMGMGMGMMNPMGMGMPNMAMPNMMNMGMGVGVGMMNPMMGMGMNGFGAMNPNSMYGSGMGGNMGRGMNGMGSFNNTNGGMGGGYNNMNGGYHGGYQGQRNFNQGGGGGGGGGNMNGDDGAYFRTPVNPQRHQNRQRRVRPSDYRELG